MNLSLVRALLCCAGKRTGHSLGLPFNVVFAITLKCNSRCKTCFIWRNPPDQDHELTTDEYKRIFKSLGRLYWVTLGGGEPFLRKDFLQIITDVCGYCKPSLVNIPSNGSRPQEMLSVMDEVTRLHPRTTFIVNLSLDHIGEKHDSVRGMPGSFDLVCKAISNLKSIKRRNFNLGIHTVISKYNLDDLEHIYGWVRSHGLADSYIIEDAQVREEYRNDGGDFSNDPHDYAKAMKFYLDNIKKVKMTGMNKIRRAFRITYYESIAQALRSGKSPHDCQAAYASCQVNPDGEVWACATKGLSLGNLRKSMYDFRELWYSRDAHEARLKIRDRKCSCHLSNVFYSNMLSSPSKLISTIYNYARY
jgi:MoaA/NifB/PqqE/SkfB family radical SAM enzyme